MVKRIVLILGLVLTTFAVKGQDTKTDTTKDKSSYNVSDESLFKDPEYPGGREAMKAFIKKNVHYPSDAKSIGIVGNVQCKVTISKDGSIGIVKVVRGIGAGCDEEAVKVLKKLPSWKPATRRGKKIAYTVLIEVPFGDRRAIIAQEIKTNYIFNQGIDLQKQKDYWGAVEKFSDAIAMSPYIDCDAYYNRGVAYYYLEDLENACMDWEKGLKYEHDMSIRMYDKYCRISGGY